MGSRKVGGSSSWSDLLSGENFQPACGHDSSRITTVVLGWGLDYSVYCIKMVPTVSPKLGLKKYSETKE